jgi:diacylglycerol kinase (ATP)
LVRRLLIIHNPTAGRRRRRFFLNVLAALERLDCVVTLQATSRRGDAEAFARTANSDEFDVIVAAGGDGTISEVVNGLLRRDDGAEDLPLGLIPLGTANVLALELGLPTRAEKLAQILAIGSRRPCYPGLANERLFLMMAGVGFDAHVVNNVSLPLKKLIGKGAYVWATLRELWRGDARRYTIHIDDRTLTAASIVISKGRLYGGRYVCTPDARLDQPSFQVCLFQRSGVWATLRYILGFMRGAIPKMKDVTLIDARDFRIEGPTGDPVQGDGDIITHLPLDIRIADKSVDLLAPV